MRRAVFFACLMVVCGIGGVGAGDLEPSALPGPTMKSLDEIAPTWSRILDSTNGEPDGCNSDRFKCVLNDEAVLDMETGLVWQRSPSNDFFAIWNDAFHGCMVMTTGNRSGWRLPTAEEFLTLVDHSTGASGFPVDHPFTDILEITCYSSATTQLSAPTDLYGFGCAGVNGSNGCGTCQISKAGAERLWCVRGGRGDVSLY